jgi:hypothetical protein
LELICKENDQNWHKSGQHTHVWYEALDMIADFYVNKVKEYGEMYMASPAGQKMKSAVIRSRKHSKALPTVDMDALLQYDGAEGIAWGIPQVYDIFSILSEITTVEDMTVQVREIYTNGANLNSLLRGTNPPRQFLHGLRLTT